MPSLKFWGGGSSPSKAQDLTEMWVSLASSLGFQTHLGQTWNDFREEPCSVSSSNCRPAPAAQARPSPRCRDTKGWSAAPGSCLLEAYLVPDGH